MKTIYKYIIFICFFLPSILPAQVYYTGDNAVYEITIQDDTYVIKAELLTDIVGSRRLQLNRNKLRLVAADLLGNYLVFKEARIGYPHIDELFEVFVDVSDLNFEAQVHHFTTSSWQTCGSTKCIVYKCKKSDFIIQESYYNETLDIAQMLQLNFERKRDLKSASRLQDYLVGDMEESIKTEAFFLSGRGALEAEYKLLLKLNPASQLQSSLFNSDSIMEGAVYNAGVLPMSDLPFEKLIKNKILFTTAPINQKDEVYDDYISALKKMKGRWWDMQYFAFQERESADFPGLDQATVFDVIAYYPLALNIFGMNIVSEGSYYQSALESFSKEDFDLCIELLQKEIDFIGISHKALNLIGATYRLQDKPAKALPFLLLAYQLNNETLYLRGNISLVLAMLNYPHIDEVNDWFLKQTNLEPWSKEQIQANSQ